MTLEKETSRECRMCCIDVVVNGKRILFEADRLGHHLEGKLVHVTLSHISIATIH